jgi:hypothetical protein
MTLEQVLTFAAGQVCGCVGGWVGGWVSGWVGEWEEVGVVCDVLLERG